MAREKIPLLSMRYSNVITYDYLLDTSLLHDNVEMSSDIITIRAVYWCRS